MVFTCRSLARPFALAEVSHTSGRATVAKVLSGPATRLATLSASAMAIRLGTSSPTTMEKYETIRVMTMGARVAARESDIPRETIHAAKGSERFVAAKAEEAKPTSVMATWIAASAASGFSLMPAATAALRSPSSASWSSSTFFAVEIAISDIEK